MQIGGIRLAKMWLVFSIFLAIPIQFINGAPAEISQINTPFWQKEPCSLNEEISKSFEEAKKMCNSREMKPKKTDVEICKKLERNFDELCKPGIKFGETQAVPKDGNICEYDIIKSESLVDACTESCIKGNLSLCEILIQTHELLTPKLGERGKGLPPLSLSDTKKVNETVSKAEEPQNSLEVSQAVSPSDVPKIPEVKETTVNIPEEKVASNVSNPVEPTKTKESIVKPETSSKPTMKDEVKETVALDNHMDDEALETQSQFFSYFVAFTIICIVGYIIYFNKKKILALLLEGRRKNSGGRSNRRSSSAQYRKLDNNLEEAMADNSDDTVRHVIY